MIVHQISVRMEEHVMMASIVTPVTVSLDTLAPTVRLVSNKMATILGMSVHLKWVGKYQTL